MEMRGREDINIGEDLTPPLQPLAFSLYNTTLSSHCSACFSPLPPSHITPTFSRNPNHVPPPSLFYCSPLCSSLDSSLHFSSSESLLLHQSPPSTCPDSSDLRLSLRLLSLFRNDAVPLKPEISENDSVLERIGGLMTNRERLLIRKQNLSKYIDDDDNDEDEDDDVLERIRGGAKAMVAARRMMMKRDGFGEEEEEEEEELFCTAVLCLVMTNAVEVQDKSGRGIGVAVYDATFSWINHRCSPNACYRFSTLEDGGANRLRICPATAVGGGGEGSVVVDECARGLIVKGREEYGPRMILRSINAIKKGEEVTITYTDLLQPKEMVAVDLDYPSSTSDHNFHSQEMIRNLIDCYEDAITEYLSFNNPESCCQKLENLLTHGQIDKQPEEKEMKSRQRIMLHPFHHLSLNAYTILASAYKVQANDLQDLNSETEKHHAEAFGLMKVSAAYSLMLAGATHHLFRSEASLIVAVANFWTSAGESLLNLARSQICDSPLKGPTVKGSSSLSNYKCCKCSLLDGINTASNHSQEQDVQFEVTIARCLSCIVDIASKLWTFLIHGECYLKVIKDPIDFRWLTTTEPFMMFGLETHHVHTDVKNSVSRIEARETNNKERIDLLQLGIHCLLLGAFLSSICYGQHSHFICNVRDILKSKGFLIT